MADKVWVTRNADGVWEAHNSDGASMQVGKGPGLFNPSDLLKVALAACGGFSSEAAMTRLLGDDAQVRIDAGGDYDSDNDRWNAFDETICLDATGKAASDEAAEKIADRIRHHIDADCTIEHTFQQATPVDISFKVKH